MISTFLLGALLSTATGSRSLAPGQPASPLDTPLRITSATQPAFGITPYLAKGGDFLELLYAVGEVRGLGGSIAAVSVKWSEVEKPGGVLDFEKIRNDLGQMRKAGFRVVATLQTLDTNNRAFPQDLAEKPLTDPTVRARFLNFVEQATRSLPDGTLGISLGNEVDAYLAEHPSELEAYATLVEEGRQRVRALKPGMPVSVTFTYGGLANQPQIVRRLNQNTDFLCFTYYEWLGSRAGAAEPGFDKALDNVLALSPRKPVFVQELGCASSTKLGFSEARQAEFVRKAFATAIERKSRLMGVSFFLMVDLSPEFVNDLVRYYRFENNDFREYLSSIGFKRHDGSPKAAWSVFAHEMVRLSYPPTGG